METGRQGLQSSGLMTGLTPDQYYFRRVVWWNHMILWRHSITDSSILRASRLWYLLTVFLVYIC